MRVESGGVLWWWRIFCIPSCTLNIYIYNILPSTSTLIIIIINKVIYYIMICTFPIHFIRVLCRHKSTELDDLLLAVLPPPSPGSTAALMVTPVSPFEVAIASVSFLVDCDVARHPCRSFRIWPSTDCTSVSMLRVLSLSTSGRLVHHSSIWERPLTTVLYRLSFFSVPKNSLHATIAESTITSTTV